MLVHQQLNPMHTHGRGLLGSSHDNSSIFDESDTEKHCGLADYTPGDHSKNDSS